jgi:hypothetical protein
LYEFISLVLRTCIPVCIIWICIVRFDLCYIIQFYSTLYQRRQYSYFQYCRIITDDDSLGSKLRTLLRMYLHMFFHLQRI